MLNIPSPGLDCLGIPAPLGQEAEDAISTSGYFVAVDDSVPQCLGFELIGGQFSSNDSLYQDLK